MDDNDLIFERKSPRGADFALSATPFHRLSCSQELRCMAECQARREVCRGINFAASRRECHLLSVTSNDAALEARAGFTYYEVRSVSRPSENLFDCVSKLANRCVFFYKPFHRSRGSKLFIGFSLVLTY